MNFLKNRFHMTPWLMVRLFAPLTFIVPMIVYGLTLYRHIYPGVPASLTAAAAGIAPTTYLSNPIFSYISQLAALIPCDNLAVLLNFFSALCGAIAIALFYLLVARIIFMLSCEDSGGAMNALPPELPNEENEAKDVTHYGADAAAGALSQNALGSIPKEVIYHNRRAAYSAILGAFGASAFLAFCGPFWFAATRLHPYTFDIMLLFLILNLVVSYDQRENLLALVASVFLLAACSVESALFLILAPACVLFLYRSMKLSEQFTTGRILLCLFAGLSGAILAIAILWNAAGNCINIEIPAPRVILNVFAETIKTDLMTWIPSYGWSRIFVLFLLPSTLAFFVFGYSFKIRKPFLFILQLLLAAMLIPSLINMNCSPWGIARQISKVPVFSYILLAVFTGFLIAVWHLMREMYIEQLDDELDFYEYRDNPFVCRIGSLLCWPLLLLILCAPFLSYTDIAPDKGVFTDKVSEILYQQIKDKKLILDIPFLSHEMLIRAHADNRTLSLYSTSSMKGGKLSREHLERIKENPDFEGFRSRLINASAISPFSFMREWLALDKQACKQIAVFSNPEPLCSLGYMAVPKGFFLELVPPDTELNSEQMINGFIDFSAAMHAYMFPGKKDEIKLLAAHRNAYRQQLALIGNELATLLIERREHAQALDILRRCAKLAPGNLSIILNSYYLTRDLGVDPDSSSYFELQLKAIPADSALLNLSVAELQRQSGSLASPGILEFAKKRFWTKSNLFRNISINQNEITLDSISAIHTKKRELYSTVTKKIAQNKLEEADSQLNILLDFDEKDHFALINKAKVAILQKNIPEAGLWMDLAQENAVDPAKLIWHKVALLMLNNKMDEARKRLNEVIPDNTSNIELWTLLAKILIRNKEYDELQDRVYPALHGTSRTQQNYMFYVVRGYILKNRGPHEYVAARAAFLKASELNNNLPDVQNEILELDSILGVPAFLEEDAVKVLIDDPEHPRANYLMGLVRLSRGQLELAEDFFVRSLKSQPSAEALAGLAETLLRRNKLDLAWKYITKSIELDPERIETLHIRTKIELALNHVDQAALSFKSVLAAKPDDLEVQITMIKLLIKQNRLEEAAINVSNLLEREDYLPRPITSQLKNLARQLSEKLTRTN